MKFVLFEAVKTYIIAVYVFSLKLSVAIVHLAQYFYIASACLTSMKSVTHQQTRWFVITLPVRAIHYII